MLTLVVVVIALLVYVVYIQTTRNVRIKHVEKMRRNHASFDDKFGKLGASDTLSWEQLKRITSVSEEEMRKSDEAYAKRLERIRIEKENAIAFERIEQNYPFGVELYRKKNPSAKHIDYINHKFEIECLDKLGKGHKHFLDELNCQKEFATKCRSIKPKDFGCHKYEIAIEHTDEYGEEIQNYPFILWQFFYFSFCRDTSLDYSSFSNFKTNYELLDDFVTCKRQLADSVYKSVADFIEKLSDDVMVLLLGPSPSQGGGYFEMDGTIHNPLFTKLKSELAKKNISYRDYELHPASIIKHNDIVLVDFVTPRASFESRCGMIIDNLYLSQSQLRLSYISIIREWSTEEMSALITEHNKKVREQEERQRAEAERKRVEEEKKRQEEERQKRITASLKSAVSSWDNVPQSDLHHDYLIRYYPTTCDFDATDSEWNDRQLIWSFKNDPNKETRISHQQALNNLIPRVKNRLESTFGNLLPNLTLVCIPASSPEKNKARYELFSELLCRGTGMSNAYSHITINSVRTARHEGGVAGGTDSIIFDEAYFKGKNILLFDDVLTRGDSMRKFGNKMSSLGANVVAGFTIGKTFHHRDEDSSSTINRFPRVYHVSLNNTRNDYEDDLPF